MIAAQTSLWLISKGLTKSIAEIHKNFIPPADMKFMSPNLDNIQKAFNFEDFKEFLSDKNFEKN